MPARAGVRAHSFNGWATYCAPHAPGLPTATVEPSPTFRAHADDSIGVTIGASCAATFPTLAEALAEACRLVPRRYLYVDVSQLVARPGWTDGQAWKTVLIVVQRGRLTRKGGLLIACHGLSLACQILNLRASSNQP